MKSFNSILFSIAIVVLSHFTFSSCEDDSSSGMNKKEINEWVYENMLQYYYWTDEIPQLDPKEESNTYEMFDDLLYSSIDKWSFITNDYEGLMQYFSGVQLTMGMSFQLYYLKPGSNQVYGVVEYVDANGPADRANIVRGDVFFKINGTLMNSSNFTELLNQDEFTLTFGNISEDRIITPVSPTIHLAAEQLSVDPINYYTIIDIADKKIGYLLLTSFIDDYEDELENVFSYFKQNNISELILDLRYNPGGHVSTAILLSSMIGPSDIAGKVMLNTTYNKYLNEFLEEEYPNEPDLFIDRFTESDYNLNLSRLFVLTSENTASASEMVIYSLKPYMNVILIGNQTHGKYYGSITIEEHKKHNWAIQPIIMRAGNATNSIDYSAGMPADYVIKDDDYSHQLGDPEEALCGKAISLITGLESQSAPTKSAHIKALGTKVSEAKERLDPKKFILNYNHLKRKTQ